MPVHSTDPEFSHKLAVDEVGGGVSVRLEASPDERVALAKRYGILSLDRLSAQLRIKPWRKCGLHVAGTMEAKAQQACVVSLEPVETDIHETVSIFLLPPGESDISPTGEVEIDPDSDDELGHLENETADLGELVAEQLAIALPAYPRKQGVTADYIDTAGAGADADGGQDSPFAILKTAIDPDEGPEKN